MKDETQSCHARADEPSDEYCCCGSPMKNHESALTCGHAPKSEKAYSDELAARTCNDNAADKLITEIQRQLSLKSEVTAIGPPYVVLKGADILSALHAYQDREAKLVQRLPQAINMLKSHGPNTTGWAVGEALAELLARTGTECKP